MRTDNIPLIESEQITSQLEAETMSKSLIFPLSILIHNSDKEMLKRILCVGLIQNVIRRKRYYNGATNKSIANDPDNEHRGFDFIIERSIENRLLSQFARDYQIGNEIHDLALTSIDGLGNGAYFLVSNEIGSLTEFERIYKEAWEFAIAYRNDYGKDAVPQIHFDILRNVFRGTIKSNMFRLLCGISAVISRTSTYKRVTNDRIYFAMKGFKSGDVMKAYTGGDITDFVTNKDGNLRLNDKERRKIDRLIKTAHEKGLIKGVWTYNRREKYFSTRLTSLEIENAVWLQKKKKSQ